MSRDVAARLSTCLSADTEELIGRSWLVSVHKAEDFSSAPIVFNRRRFQSQAFSIAGEPPVRTFILTSRYRPPTAAVAV
jgi:hypothetical protein